MPVIAEIIAAADRMALIEDGNQLAREAVEFARDALELERVSIYLSEPEATQVVMRGTWGTSEAGTTISERSLVHACTCEDFERLRNMHQRGELWQYCDLNPDEIDVASKPRGELRSWLAVTPLIVATDVIGVMYNDTAISNRPLNEAKQTYLALFGSLVAGIAQARLRGLRDGTTKDTVAKNSRLIRRALTMLNADPQLTGELLARHFNVSPGHLARTFKQEMGASLVDYRNRLRLDRFFSLMQLGERNLLQTALEAGFGSYAQFHRVHRQVTGVAPRQYASSIIRDKS